MTFNAENAAGSFYDKFITGLILLLMLVSLSYPAISKPYLRPVSNIADTSNPQYISSHPYTYKIGPLTLPDTLGGRKYGAKIFIDGWVDSTGTLLSMYPKVIDLYRKGSEKISKRVKQFKDSKWNTVMWENINSESKRYIDWINKVLPSHITFIRVRYPLADGCVYLPPMKNKNWVWIIVHIK